MEHVTKHRARSLVAASTLVLFIGGLGGMAGASTTPQGPLHNPPANVALPLFARSSGPCKSHLGPRGTPTPRSTWNCASPCIPKDVPVAHPNAAGCIALVVQAINAAQRSEHRPLIVLPTNFRSLSPTQQMFVIVDLERITHGVPPLVGLAPALNLAAAKGASSNTDPAFAAVFGPLKVWFPPTGGDYAFDSEWSGGDINTLVTVFGWMYVDGWGGPHNTWNRDCTTPHALACWGHRDGLLGLHTGTTCQTCVAGAAYVDPRNSIERSSYAFVVIRPIETHPVLSFRWDSELAYLPAPWERVAA